jgi:zinc transport system permease protein
MNQLIEIFSYPFMLRALLGGSLLAVLISVMGIFVVLRRSSFFGDAIAHASLTGIALGLLFKKDPIFVAVIYAVLVSLSLPFLKKYSKLPLDSLLGFILPFSMGLGVILLAFIPGYQPELISFLFGSVLAVSSKDIVLISILAVLTLITMFFFRKKLIFSSFDSQYAKISNINVERMDIIYHMLLAVTIVAGIRLVGIILVNALLVIPASTVRIFAKSLNQVFILTPLLSLFIVVNGLVVSVLINIPSGPSIAVVSGIIFLAAVISKKFIYS